MTSGGRRQPDEEPAAAPFIDISDLQKPLTLRLNEPASITVRISGCPRPSVRWQIGRKRVKESPKYHVDSDGDQLHVLTVSRVTRDLEQGVWVVATNVFGEDCSLVEVRTLEIIFKQRKYKKEKHSIKRATSLNSEQSAVLSAAHSTTSSLSARNRSIITLKDWKEEMDFRNKMRSVDDLVFTADKASLMSGFGYSLSADLGDSDDPDLIEQFHSLSKRSRRRRSHLPPVPVQTSANLVFHELEPRRTEAKGGSVAERDSAPSRAHRLPEPVRDKTIPPDLEDFQNESIDGKEKKTKKKKKKREKSKPAIKKSLDRHANEEDDDDDDDDDDDGGGDGDGGGERNLFVVEEGSAWDLFGENLSNFCQNIFDKFSNLGTKEEAEGDKFAGIVNNPDQKTSKLDVLKPLPASDQPNFKIDKNPSLKAKSKVKKHVARNKVPVETTAQVTTPGRCGDQLNVDKIESISDVQNALSNSPEKRKKPSKRRDFLSKDTDKPEQIGELYNATNGSLVCGKIDANHTQEKRKTRQKESKFDVKSNEMAERDEEICHRLQENGSTENPTRKKKRTKTKETTSNAKSKESNNQENQSTEPDTERLLTTAGDISNIQENKEQFKTATVTEPHENDSTPLTQTLSEPTITKKNRPSSTKSSSKASKTKHKKNKEAVKTKPGDKMPLNSSYAVISEDGFIVEIQTEPRAVGTTLNGTITKKSLEPVVPESIEILNKDSNIKPGLKEFPTGEKSGNPVTEIRPTGKSKSKKRKQKANFPRDSKTEFMMVDGGDVSETQFNDGKSSVSCETAVPISDIIDYCDEPIRRKPGSTRALSSSDARRSSDSEQMDKNKQLDGRIGEEILSKTLDNQSSENASVVSLKSTENVIQQKDSNEAVIERKEEAESNGRREKQKKKRVGKTRKPTSSQAFTSEIGSTVPDATPNTSSITGQVDIPTNVGAVPPGPGGSDLDQTLVRENFSILDAKETSILKALAEKLKSGQIEIIIVNKDTKSNENAAQSKADDLISTLSNLCGASVTDKLTDHEGTKSSLVETGEMLKGQKGIQDIGNTSEKDSKNINDSQLTAVGALSSEQISENLGQVLRDEPPTPKPRLLVLGRNSKIELKTENIVDDKINEVQTLSAPAKGRNVSEFRDSAEFRTETELENRNFHAQSFGLSDARTENEANGEVFGEKSFQSRRKFFENQSSQHSVQKEAKRSQQLFSETVKLKFDSATQVSPKSKTPGHNDSTSHSKNAVTSRSTGSQTDAVTSSTDDVIAKNRASFSNKSELLKIDKDETSKVERISDNCVTANSSRTTQTTRQKPAKTYVPVFSNYYPGYGQVYRRGVRSYHVRNGGPIEYLPDLLPALANPSRQAIRPKPTDSKGNEDPSLDKLVNKEPSLKVDFAKTTKIEETQQCSLLSNSETSENSQQKLEPLTDLVRSDSNEQQCNENKLRAVDEETVCKSRHLATEMKPETSGHLPTEMKTETSDHLPTEMKPEAGGHLPTEMKPEAGGHLPTEMKPEAGGHLPTEMKPEAGGHLPTEMKPEASDHLPTEMKPEASDNLPTGMKPETSGHLATEMKPEAGDRLPSEVKPETAKREEFVTFAVSYEYGEVIKLLPAK